jgi:hypothetical protein
MFWMDFGIEEGYTEKMLSIVPFGKFNGVNL